MISRRKDSYEGSHAQHLTSIGPLEWYLPEDLVEDISGPTSDLFMVLDDCGQFYLTGGYGLTRFAEGDYTAPAAARFPRMPYGCLPPIQDSVFEVLRKFFSSLASASASRTRPRVRFRRDAYTFRVDLDVEGATPDVRIFNVLPAMVPDHIPVGITISSSDKCPSFELDLDYSYGGKPPELPATELGSRPRKLVAAEYILSEFLRALSLLGMPAAYLEGWRSNLSHFATWATRRYASTASLYMDPLRSGLFLSADDSPADTCWHPLGGDGELPDSPYYLVWHHEAGKGLTLPSMRTGADLKAMVAGEPTERGHVIPYSVGYAFPLFPCVQYLVTPQSNQ